ncbi:hypothetical protein GGX14DRAFT_567194 [Mycena pura]|uniref:Uncharacterized protein n=1 Tax=Mycena pura TaxID=153505 RepID=A0AAD6VEV7_9AGAR|nr:hypothetical protein GGX14DRAFT_567194 [Mycena pura]
MSDDETDLNMILGTVRDAPDACHKFMRPLSSSNPPSTKKRKPSSASKEDVPARSSKRKRLTAKDDEDTIDINDNDDDLDERPPPQITVYPKIVVPAPPPKRVGARQPPPTLHPFAPFSFTEEHTYSDFLSFLCEKLGCAREQLLPRHEAEMKFKPQKPKTAESDVVGGESGFKIMAANIFKKKPEYHTIDVLLPPPSAVRTAAPDWSTDDTKPNFDPSAYETPTPNLTSNSIAAQRASINEQSRSEQQALLDHYPIGNVPHLDNKKRYWKQVSTGHYFELNTLRIGVWANAMASGREGVDLQNPPASIHFDANARVKIIHGRNIEDVSNSAQTVPSPSSPRNNDWMAQQMQMQMQQMQQMQMMQMQLCGFPYPFRDNVHSPDLPRPFQAVNHARHLRSTHPSPVKRHSVTVSQFCAYYDIDDTDRDRLIDLGFRPGRPIPSELDNGLIELGFVRFVWVHIVDCNRRFRNDLAAGVFDEAMA